MKKTAIWIVSLLSCLCLFTGCQGENLAQTENSKRDSIPFSDGQLYAVAYLGYQQMENLERYKPYLDSDALPIHYLSPGDYYLVIPRYAGMKVALYQNDMESSQPRLLFKESTGQPFLLQCNVSDIFPDATIRFTYKGEVAECSPFLSLKDGTLEIGAQGLDLTREENPSS